MIGENSVPSHYLNWCRLTINSIIADRIPTLMGKLGVFMGRKFTLILSAVYLPRRDKYFHEISLFCSLQSPNRTHSRLETWCYLLTFGTIKRIPSWLMITWGWGWGWGLGGRGGGGEGGVGWGVGGGGGESCMDVLHVCSYLPRPRWYW